MRTDGQTLDERTPPVASRLRSTERLRRLADLWPSLDDEERALLESHLHRLREKASA